MDLVALGASDLWRVPSVEMIPINRDFASLAVGVRGGIREIVSLDGQTFVYVGSEIAHIFPRDKIGNEEYDAFVGKLVKGWECRSKLG